MISIAVVNDYAVMIRSKEASGSCMPASLNDKYHRVKLNADVKAVINAKIGLTGYCFSMSNGFVDICKICY